MAQYTFTGIGKPKIEFDDGRAYVLPEPNGEKRKGLRQYGFERFTRGGYISEAGNYVEIGLKHRFVANLMWKTLDKASLQQLFKAQNEGSFYFVLNLDAASIKFKCRVEILNHDYFEGFLNSKPGYEVSIKLVGVELLNSAGYPVGLEEEEGYGTNYGSQAGNQGVG